MFVHFITNNKSIDRYAGAMSFDNEFDVQPLWAQILPNETMTVLSEPGFAAKLNAKGSTVKALLAGHLFWKQWAEVNELVRKNFLDPGSAIATIRDSKVEQKMTYMMPGTAISTDRQHRSLQEFWRTPKRATGPRCTTPN